MQHDANISWFFRLFDAANVTMYNVNSTCYFLYSNLPTSIFKSLCLENNPQSCLSYFENQQQYKDTISFLKVHVSLSRGWAHQLVIVYCMRLYYKWTSLWHTPENIVFVTGGQGTELERWFLSVSIIISIM